MVDRLCRRRACGDGEGNRRAVFRLRAGAPRPDCSGKGLGKAHGDICLGLQPYNRLFRRCSLLFTPDGADAGRQRDRAGVQHAGGNARKRSRVRCDLDAWQRAQLRAEPAGLLCTRPPPAMP